MLDAPAKPPPCWKVREATRGTGPQILPAGGRHLMTNSHTFATNNELAQETQATHAAAIALLNQHLADMADLYSQIKQAHWNVKGMQFFQLHELFDRLADEVRNHVDLIAERSTARNPLFQFGEDYARCHKCSLRARRRRYRGRVHRGLAKPR